MWLAMTLLFVLLQVKLSDYIGKKYVILFFYPLDFTFVCPTGEDKTLALVSTRHVWSGSTRF
jgi:hypothetical protein